MITVKGHLLQWIERNRIFQVTGIEIDDVMDSFLGNEVEDTFRQVTVRVD